MSSESLEASRGYLWRPLGKRRQPAVRDLSSSCIERCLQFSSRLVSSCRKLHNDIMPPLNTFPAISIIFLFVLVSLPLPLVKKVLTTCNICRCALLETFMELGEESQLKLEIDDDDVMMMVWDGLRCLSFDEGPCNEFEGHLGHLNLPETRLVMLQHCCDDVGSWQNVVDQMMFLMTVETWQRSWQASCDPQIIPNLWYDTQRHDFPSPFSVDLWKRFAFRLDMPQIHVLNSTSL